mmetsp:Transcript_116/g.184  ORF Transcript_116/g.184 Transcript_116/m.184 type:complete len:96 (+) Transcript_116:122-409(+)
MMSIFGFARGITTCHSQKAFQRETLLADCSIATYVKMNQNDSRGKTTRKPGCSFFRVVFLEPRFVAPEFTSSILIESHTFNHQSHGQLATAWLCD